MVLRLSTLFALGIALFGAFSTSAAEVYNVGPDRSYKRIADVVALVKPGDTVLIDPGVYREAVHWTGGKLDGEPITIRGAGVGVSIVDGTNVNVSGSGPIPRALFQIEGDNYVVEDLEFRNARNADNNGAGVRVVNGRKTVLRRVRLVGSDMGIMSSKNDDLLVEYSEIAYNGTPLFNGFAHNFYLDGDRVRVQYCYIHDATSGQNFKARSRYVELLYNYIVDSHDSFDGGEPSKEIGLQTGELTDRPNSHAILIGNTIVKRGTGWGFIDFGPEGSEGGRNGALFMINNTVIREAKDNNLFYFRLGEETQRAVLYNNIFYGSNIFSRGAAEKNFTGSNNWFMTGTALPEGLTNSIFGDDPGFMSLAKRDYRLRPDSPVLDAGTAAAEYLNDTGQPVTAVATRHYLHHMHDAERRNEGAPDLGAYELAAADRGNTATISGRLVDATGRALANQVVTVNNEEHTGSIKTGEDGRFEFTGLRPGAAYVISPWPGPLTFVPSEKTVTAESSPIDQEFVSPPAFNIFGRVMATHNSPVEIARMFLAGSGYGWALSDKNGQYRFAMQPGGDGYTVSINRWRYSIPDPVRKLNLTADSEVNFDASFLYSISGSVTDPDGRPVPGVTVAISQDRTGTTVTDVNGRFGFLSMNPEGGTYEVRVSPSSTGLTFSPNPARIENLDGDVTLAFQSPPLPMIRVRATDIRGRNLPSVSVRVTGTQQLTAVTGADGTAMLRLLEGGGYTITGVLTGFVFQSKTVADFRGLDSIEIVGTPYTTLQGRVLDHNGAAVAGVAVILSTGRSATTNASGGYAFTNLLESTALTIRLSKKGYTFDPPTVDIITSPNQVLNFAAIPLYNITGRVTDAAGKTLSRVTINLSGSQTLTTATNSAGDYTLANVPAVGSYVVTPVFAGYTFAPESSAVSLTAGSAKSDFKGTKQ